jgi:hypothetical protein
MPDPKQLARLIMWLAALGGVILLAGKVVGRTATKASSAL